jgi:hypothetical protein
MATQIPFSMSCRPREAQGEPPFSREPRQHSSSRMATWTGAPLPLIMYRFNAERYWRGHRASLGSRFGLPAHHHRRRPTDASPASFRLGSRDGRIIARSRADGGRDSRNDAVGDQTVHRILNKRRHGATVGASTRLWAPNCVRLGGRYCCGSRRLPDFQIGLPRDHEAIDRAHMGGAGCVLSRTLGLSRDAVLVEGTERSGRPRSPAESQRLADSRTSRDSDRCRLHAEPDPGPPRHRTSIRCGGIQEAGSPRTVAGGSSCARSATSTPPTESMFER